MEDYLGLGNLSLRRNPPPPKSRMELRQFPAETINRERERVKTRIPIISGNLPLILTFLMSALICVSSRSIFRMMNICSLKLWFSLWANLLAVMYVDALCLI